MNGADPNFPEAGTTGAYSGNPIPNAASEATTYSAGTAGAESYGTPGYAPPYGYAAPVTPPAPGGPNPGLAALLGFIPGVGAMYNGQFAKGIAHIVIFAVLTSLKEHVNDLFVLLVMGWIAYMVFDAYQTARARREGLVPPDPFGLNNIGERFGVHGNPNWNDFVARPAPGTPAAEAQAAAQASAGAAPFGSSFNPAAGNASNPYAGGAFYAPPAAYPAGTVPPADYPEAFRQQQDMGAQVNAPYQAAYPGFASVPPPYASPYASTYAPDGSVVPPPVAPAPSSGLPAGAIWLIALGSLALIGSLAHNFYWSGRIFWSFSALVAGVVLIVVRTTSARRMYPEGTAAYRWNLLHQNRFGVLILIAGILQALDGVGIAGWHYTWPYMLIAFGLYQVLDRALYNRMISEVPVNPLASPYAVPQQSAADASGTAPVANHPVANDPEQEVR